MPVHAKKVQVAKFSRDLPYSVPHGRIVMLARIPYPKKETNKKSNVSAPTLVWKLTKRAGGLAGIAHLAQVL